MLISDWSSDVCSSGLAALSPAAYSMLSDVFPRNRLARAMAVYSIGVPLGAGIALILGSFVVQAVLAAPAIDLPLIGPVERSEERRVGHEFASSCTLRWSPLH